LKTKKQPRKLQTAHSTGVPSLLRENLNTSPEAASMPRSKNLVQQPAAQYPRISIIWFAEKKPGVNINLKDYICDISIPNTVQPYKFIDVVLKTNQEMFLNPENIIKAINLKYNVEDYFLQKIEMYDKDYKIFR